MIKLSARVKPLGEVVAGRFIGLVTTRSDTPYPLRRSRFLLLDARETGLETPPEGFAATFYKGNSIVLGAGRRFAPNSYLLPEDQSYIRDGDVMRLDASAAETRTMYRREARQNALLVTERCNSFCLMCSQPPRDIDDSYLVEELAQVIPLIDRDTVEVGFTGGEPTILGDGLVRLMRLCKNYLPNTSLHILSNGRNFRSAELAKKVAGVQHHDVMFGIPLYSDVSTIHDYVVQADNAFDETIRGILNLKSYGVPVEIRVVVHKATYERLPQLAEFITRNLLFVDHVALMGLEPTGFAKPNIDALWIDPTDYKSELQKAVATLNAFKMNVSIYNHQLCLLDKRLWRYAVRSISDWKNEFVDECAKCAVRNSCGGFFSSSSFRISPNIKALTDDSVETGAMTASRKA